MTKIDLIKVTSVTRIRNFKCFLLLFFGFSQLPELNINLKISYKIQIQLHPIVYRTHSKIEIFETILLYQNVYKYKKHTSLSNQNIPRKIEKSNINIM